MQNRMNYKQNQMNINNSFNKQTLIRKLESIEIIIIQILFLHIIVKNILISNKIENDQDWKLKINKIVKIYTIKDNLRKNYIQIVSNNSKRIRIIISTKKNRIKSFSETN